MHVSLTWACTVRMLGRTTRMHEPCTRFQTSKTRIGTVTSLWVPFYLDCLFFKDIVNLQMNTHFEDEVHEKTLSSQKPTRNRNLKLRVRARARKTQSIYFIFLCIGKVLSSSVYFNSNV